MSKASDKANERKEAIEQLRKMLPKGSTAYTILRRCSASGMTRDISVVVIERSEYGNREYEPRVIDYLVSRVLDRPLGKKEGIKVVGCRMDMGFEVVYSLSRVVHDDGYAISHRWL